MEDSLKDITEQRSIWSWTSRKGNKDNSHGIHQNRDYRNKQKKLPSETQNVFTITENIVSNPVLFVANESFKF